MKKRLTNNFWMKILSLAIAIVFWFVIINTKDPVESKIFRDVPVTVLNEDKVLEREKVLEVIEGDTVDVKVEGRRSVLEKMTEADIVATADLTEVSFMDTVLIRASVPNHPEVSVLNNGENMMKLSFEDYVTKHFSFKVKTMGETMSGYFVGDALPSPNIIQISGAESVLDKIKEVVLEVDVSGRSVDFTTTAVPVVYDMNGDVIGASKIDIQSGTENVTVNVPILASKEVELRVKTVGEVEEGYEILTESIEFQPEKILVAGTKEELDKLGSFLTVEVNVAGQKGVIERNIQINTLLDKSLTSLRVVNEQIFSVKITVTPYVERVLEIPVSEIELRNVGEGLIATLVQTTGVSVTLKCKTSRAPLITVDSLNPYVDLSGYTEGTYTLPLSLELPTKVLWGEEKELEVVITRQSEE